MKSLSTCFSVALLAVIFGGCMIEVEPPPHQCFSNLEESHLVTIQEMKRDGRVEIVEKDGAGVGSVVGAVGAGVLAVATGGIAPAVAAIGGGAVGGLVGDASGTETTRTSTDCSFRVMLDENTPLTYTGTEGGWSYEKAYKKCTMLRVGDKITVKITRRCDTSGHINRLYDKVYMWESGPTTGPLN
ncbi:MAG: hypothetical protein NTU97_02185 [Candidatus Magasanikbacteria bacterium]|nr:hypothetical protein [Candidatus Magasanikbacteria bacterium]